MFSLVVLAWARLSWLIDYRLSYAAMLGIDFACLAAIGGYALVHRLDFVRTHSTAA